MMAPSVSARRRASSASGSVPGRIVSTSVCRTSGAATEAVAAANAGTPGTTSVSKRPASRSCMYM